MPAKPNPTKRAAAGRATSPRPKRQKQVIDLDEIPEPGPSVPEKGKGREIIRLEYTPEPAGFNIEPWSRPLTKQDWMDLYEATRQFYQKKNPFPAIPKGHRCTLTIDLWKNLHNPN
ncbi:hypothetical protein IFR05_015413, partial [Cadophora sp. M221]